MRSRDRALRCAVPEQLLRALVGEQQLARRGLGDDHAERQLANERGQALALAVRLLVERAVVERKRDSAGDLRGELLQIVVGRRLRLPAEGEGAERAPAYEHGRREHRADADALDGDAVLRAAIRGVREIDRRRHDLRLAGADRDSHGRVAREHRGVALEHESGLVHLRIRVDDDEPAHLVTRHDVHDALVGQGRHDEIGQRPQRRIGLERAGELLADRGQQAQRSAPAPLGVEHARALRARRRTARPSSLRIRGWSRRRRGRGRSGIRARRVVSSPTRSGTDAVGAPRAADRPGRAPRARPRRGRRAGRPRWPRRSACAARAGSGARPRSPRR